MNVQKLKAGEPSLHVDVRDALSVEVVPMLDALHRLVSFSEALREVDEVARNEPELGRRLALGGVDLPELLDQPDREISGLVYAILLRTRALARSPRGGSDV